MSLQGTTARSSRVPTGGRCFHASNPTHHVCSLLDPLDMSKINRITTHWPTRDLHLIVQASATRSFPKSPTPKNLTDEWLKTSDSEKESNIWCCKKPRNLFEPVIFNRWRKKHHISFPQIYTQLLVNVIRVLAIQFDRFTFSCISNWSTSACWLLEISACPRVAGADAWAGWRTPFSFHLLKSSQKQDVNDSSNFSLFYVHVFACMHL